MIGDIGIARANIKCYKASVNTGLSDYKIKKIMRHFCEDITTSKNS